ncbi:polysaccharide biosynthesis protein [[Eubacterium] hominis]|uniref:polysaccharide biosynthesis protein n=1 Tax=[Eubacterium] hominis TaxID=2764325 RepID=UPI003A4E43D1
MKKKLFHPRMIALVLWDVFSIAAVSYVSLILRFDGTVPQQYMEGLRATAVPVIMCGILVFYLFHLYKSLWEFASLTEMKNIVVASIGVSLLNIAVSVLTDHPMPKSSYFIFFLLLTAMTGGSRFLYRFLRSYKSKSLAKSKEASHAMIIGAGDAGEKLAKEILHSSHVYKEVKCFIDDDSTKWNRSIHDIPVVGGRDAIVEAVKKYEIQEILIAMPSVSRKEMAEVLNICKQTKCKLMKLPGMYQFVNGDITITKLKDVEIQDLLGREPIKVNMDDIMGYVKDKVVMITGGGGSIGSELCRQIVANDPKQLIIVDIYENNAYDIQLELKHDYPNLKLETMIASVRDKGKINDLFKKYHPDIVYHAAAHKHVPLMEDAPNEAIKNNVFGTLNVVKAADQYGVKKFILISTDKAVNPTNIMGATKRICEMIVQTYNKKSKTDYVAVRFGNVLGSNGSVIPLFKKQIEQGGPVTVTHPDIIRFFMTIPEAVSLVLQAGAYAKGGEIFVLDMGEPVKIADMARNLIRLSGYEPDVDIKIEYTGLRPGEKLYEEMLMKEEGMQTTGNKLIHIGKPIEMDEEALFLQLEKLYEAAYAETDQMRELVQQLVTTYHPETVKG